MSALTNISKNVQSKPPALGLVSTYMLLVHWCIHNPGSLDILSKLETNQNTTTVDTRSWVDCFSKCYTEIDDLVDSPNLSADVG